MTEHSNVSNTWSTKLKRIGALASKDPSLRFTNLGHVIDLEMLRDMYHQLDGKKAVGVDRQTKAAYGKHLEANLQDLLKRLRRGTYRPKPARLVEIPKEDGSKRPLAICSLEDKLVQLAVHTLLTPLYEPQFMPSSYGGRPGRNAHGALRALMNAADRVNRGALVEIDIRQYFNSIPHAEMMQCMNERVGDQRLLGLIRKLLQTPCQTNTGTVESTTCGCPQGSIISPLLANIYLHHVVDKWFAEIRQSHFGNGATMVRYLDDMVFVFQRTEDAVRFYKVLPKRLKKYGLELHEGKSALLKCGRSHAKECYLKGKKMPVFKFLGFTAYWGKARNGQYWRLKYSSRKDRFTSKLKSMRDYLWKHRATNAEGYILRRVTRVVRGWINYHGISDNSRRVNAFIYHAKRLLFQWFNRRGGRKRMTWKRFVGIVARISFPERWKTVSMFTSAPNKG
jgi:RNA-directed DNA polymerase